ncbi:HU family DNA-binding protein [Planctomicrobium sp. SH527]|uniref:HU family DNA-binding protein n=1 Tax=Planctomicrobium sp. SH527 TaxID=3448123 RepID=UPI003F5BCA80
MTKKEIVKTISEECGLTQLKTKEIVQKTFEAIIDTLVTESRIELRNFGVFEVKKRAARKARNPRSGERVDVPEKFVVTFKPGKEMEERVLQLQEAAAQQATELHSSEPVRLEAPATPVALPAPLTAPAPSPAFPSNPSPYSSQPAE